MVCSSTLQASHITIYSSDSSQNSSRCAALCFIPQWPLTIAILQQATPWGEFALVGGCTAQCGHNDMSFLMTWRGGQASDRTRFWTQAYTRDGLWIHLCALQPGTPLSREAARLYCPRGLTAPSSYPAHGERVGPIICGSGNSP